MGHYTSKMSSIQAAHGYFTDLQSGRTAPALRFDPSSAWPTHHPRPAEPSSESGIAWELYWPSRDAQRLPEWTERLFDRGALTTLDTWRDAAQRLAALALMGHRAAPYAVYARRISDGARLAVYSAGYYLSPTQSNPSGFDAGSFHHECAHDFALLGEVPAGTKDRRTRRARMVRLELSR